MDRRSFIKTAGIAVAGASSAASTARAADKKTLVIDKVVHPFTPQSGNWCICFEVEVDGNEERHKSSDHGGKDAEVQLNLKLEGIDAGAMIDFTCFLDDNIEKVCSNAEDRSKGSFKATVKGKKTFRFKGPKDDKTKYYPVGTKEDDNIEWEYTIQWHME